MLVSLVAENDYLTIISNTDVREAEPSSGLRMNDPRLIQLSKPTLSTKAAAAFLLSAILASGRLSGFNAP